MKALQSIKRFLILKALSFHNKEVASVVRKVVDKNLSYLDIEALCDLVQVAINNEKKRLKGIIVETGCALGGSAIALASAKNKHRELFVYDVFGIIPPPSMRDGQDVYKRYEVILNKNSVGLGGNTYYGYEEDLYNKVLQSFADFGFEVKESNIFLVKGLYEDTLDVDLPVALAHIDCDWYSSVFTCLSQIEPKLVSGGTLIIDDYYAWSGCQAAVDEYFENVGKENFNFIQKRRLHIIKK